MKRVINYLLWFLVATIGTIYMALGYAYVDEKIEDGLL